MPAAHSVHVLAPELLPVLVMEPAAQVEHEPSVEAAAYVPAAHSVHVLAPELLPVLVMEPAAQGIGSAGPPGQ